MISCFDVSASIGEQICFALATQIECRPLLQPVKSQTDRLSAKLSISRIRHAIRISNLKEQITYFREFVDRWLTDK
jgi:hypothetical protein